MMMPLGSFVRNLKLIELCLPVSQGGSTCKPFQKELVAKLVLCQTYQVRFTCGKGYRILWIAAGTLIFHIARYLYELGATFGQINEIQVQSIRRELHLAQATHEVVVHTCAEQSARIDRASHINSRRGQHGELACDVRVIRVHVIHHGNELCDELKGLERRSPALISRYAPDRNW